MKGLYWLLGYEELQIEGRHAPCFLNLCRSTGWSYQPLPDAEEGLRIRCLLSVGAALRPACRARGIEVVTLRRGGLPLLALRYRHRVGLLLGLLLAAAVIFYGSHTLWDVRVRGNQTVSEDSILEQLAALGLTEGAMLARGVPDTRELENRLLQASPDLAWVSINLRGTVAEVQVRELQSGQSAVDERICNLVASCDGVVTEVRLLSGEVVVDVGQPVRAGELLISGVRDSQTQGFDVMGARGEVMAQTEHTETVRIPLLAEEKVFTGEEICEKSLFFFKKTIKFSKNTGILGRSCDTIYTMENFTLPTGIPLPIGVTTVRTLPYTIQLRERTREEAYALAKQQLDAVLQDNARDALLLRKESCVSYTDTHCVLVCKYVCLRNIATPVPLEWSGANDGAAS